MKQTGTTTTTTFQDGDLLTDISVNHELGVAPCITFTLFDGYRDFELEELNNLIKELKDAAKALKNA